MGKDYYPDYQLHAGTPGAGFGGYPRRDFPLHKPWSDPATVPFNTGENHHDVISSQGVICQDFIAITQGTSVDSGAVIPDPNFSYPDPAHRGQVIDTRKVEPRNTPSAVNAVFNYRNSGMAERATSANGANRLASATPRRIFSPHLRWTPSLSLG